MGLDRILIKVENGGRIICVIFTDRHVMHIIHHLPFFWRKGMFRHILEHFKIYTTMDKDIRNLKLTLDDIVYFNKNER